MIRISLEERTDRHPQLMGKRRYSEVPVGVVQARLATARYVAAGSFCRVWHVERWNAPGSPAHGQAVVSAVVECSRVFHKCLESACNHVFEQDDERPSRRAASAQG